MKRSKLRILGYVLILFTVLLGAGYVFLPYFFDNIIKLEVRNIVKESLQGKASFQQIQLSSYTNLPYLSISLDSVVLKSEVNGKTDTLFTANKISFSISLKDWILDHKYVVKEISLLTPVIKANIYANGQSNYGFLLSKDTANVKSDTSKFNFKVNLLSIKDGKIKFRDFKAKHLIESQELNLDGGVNISNTNENLKIKFSTHDFIFKYNGINYLYKNVISADLILDFNKDDNSITFNDHVIQIDNFKFGFIGFVMQKTDSTIMDLQFETKDSDLKTIISLIPGIYKKDYDKFDAKGEFSLNAEIKGMFNAKQNISPAYFAHFTLKNGSFQYNHLPKPISDIKMDLRFEKLSAIAEPTIILNKFEAKLDSNYVNGVFTVNGLLKPNIVGRANAILELHELDKYFKIDSLETSGHVMANLTVNGVYDALANRFPTMQGNIVMNKGYFKRTGFDHTIENVEMETSLNNTSGFMENTSLKLSKLNLNIGDEFIEMYGKMEDFKKYNFDLFLKSDIDLKKISQILNLENQTLTGSINTKIIAKGSADKYKEAYINGTANFKDVHILDRNNDLDIKIKKGSAVFSPEMLLLSNFDMKLKNESFIINGIIKNAMPYVLKEKAVLQANLRLTADSLNLNNLFVSEPTTQIKDTISKEKKIESEAKFPGLDNLNLDLAMNVKHFQFDKYHLLDLKANMKASSKLITFNKTSFRSIDAIFQISSAQITPSNFDMNLEIDELDTKKLMSLIYDTKTDSSKVEDETGALVDINYKLKGELDKDLKPIIKSLSGYGLISVDKASIKGLKVFTHISNLTDQKDVHHQEVHDAMILTEIKGGKVHIKPFTVNLGKYITSFEGTHSFENELNYFVKLGIPPFQKVKIPMHITGTIDKPEVKITQKH